MNGVKFTGEQFDFGNLRVYIVEEPIPFLEPEFFDFLEDIKPVIHDPPKRSSHQATNNNLKQPPEELDIEVEVVPKPTKEDLNIKTTRYDKFKKTESIIDESKSTDVEVFEETTKKASPKKEFFSEFFVQEPIANFVEEFIQELNSLNSRASEFVNHFSKNNLGQFLDEGK